MFSARHNQLDCAKILLEKKFDIFHVPYTLNNSFPLLELDILGNI